METPGSALHGHFLSPASRVPPQVSFSSPPRQPGAPSELVTDGEVGSLGEFNSTRVSGGGGCLRPLRVCADS
jgi:hypothetical protein